MENEAKKDTLRETFEELGKLLAIGAKCTCDLAVRAAKSAKKSWDEHSEERQKIKELLLVKKDKFVLWLKKKGISASAFDRIVASLDKLSAEELEKLKTILNEM